MTDLERGALLEDLFRLPFEFGIADLLFSRELSGPLGDQLQRRGLCVEELRPAEVARASALRRLHAELSIPDAFAFALSEARGWRVLMGDRGLRRLAIAEQVEIRDALWVFDQLEVGRHVSLARLRESLAAISAHPRCRLPGAETRRRLARYAEGERVA